MEVASSSSALPSGSLTSVTSGMMEAGQQMCHNLYLQTKQPVTYPQIEASLIEQTSKGKKASTAKVVEALRNLTFYTPDEQLMDVLFNALGQLEDRKIAGAVYHFLSTAPQQLRSDGLTNQLKDVLTKETKHTSVGRRALALRTLATLAPADNKAIEEFMADTISAVVLKVSDDETDHKAQRRGTFRRHKTNETSEVERPLDQAGALLAARYRFGSSRPMIPVALRGLFCDDPVGARHATALCLQLAAMFPAEVAEGLKELLPQNAARTPRTATTGSTADRPNLADTWARAQFVRLCGRLALAPEVSRETGEAFFQALCQAVLDLNERIAFEAVAALSAFPWSRLHAARVLPIADEYGYKPSGRVSLAKAVVTRIVQALSAGDRSPVALHAACRMARLFARARIVNATTHLRGVDSTLDVMCRPLLALLPQQSANNNNSSGSSGNTSSASSGAAGPAGPAGSVETGRIHIEREAMRALVWLTFPHHNTHTFGAAFGHVIRTNIIPSDHLADLFRELHERMAVTPDMIKFVTKLVYVWYANVPDKTNADVVTNLWTTVLRLDEEFDARGRKAGDEDYETDASGGGGGADGEDDEDYRYAELGDTQVKAKALREVLLKHVFKVLDCQHKRPSPVDVRRLTEVVWRLRARFLHFVADNAQALAAWDVETGADVDESAAVKAILLRLEAALVSGSWEERIVASEGVAKLAFRYPALRSQVGHLFTSSAEPASRPAAAAAATTAPAKAAMATPAVPWVAAPAVHLMEMAAGLQEDRGVSFLSLPLEERRAAAEVSAKVKSQMGLFGAIATD